MEVSLPNCFPRLLEYELSREISPRAGEKEGEKSSLGCHLLMPVQSVDRNTKVGVVIK